MVGPMPTTSSTAVSAPFMARAALVGLLAMVGFAFHRLLLSREIGVAAGGEIWVFPFVEEAGLGVLILFTGKRVWELAVVGSLDDG